MKSQPNVLLLILIAAALVVIPAGITYMVKQQEVDDKQQQLSQLENTVDQLEDEKRQLSYNTATGGGVNLKMMPDPETGEMSIPMYEVFSFDRNHALCRVETNAQAFKMPTYDMGEVVIEPHQFFMSMVVTSIEQFEVTTETEGTRRVMMRGGLDCATEVGQADTRFGSRDVAEHATYRIDAVDMGIGGGEAGDRFEFTVFFDPEEAPVNHAIFGPEFTFTGEMIEGEVTILDPKALSDDN
jgi:hypothetical protein